MCWPDHNRGIVLHCGFLNQPDCTTTLKEHLSPISLLHSIIHDCPSPNLSFCNCLFPPSLGNFVVHPVKGVKVHLTINYFFRLRLLQTFMGVLQKNIGTRAVFKETLHTLYIKKRLENIEFDIIMFCFGFCFPKVAEAVNFKMSDWRSSELIQYQMQLFMQNNCAVLITKDQSPKAYWHFVFSICYLSIDLSSWTIKKFA